MIEFLVAAGVFACFLSLHFWLAASVAWRRGWRLGLIALVMVPAAPLLGFRVARALSIAWMVGLLGYGVSLLAL